MAYTKPVTDFRTGVLAPLLAERKTALAGTSGRSVRGSLAAQRGSVLGDLASTRQSIIENIQTGGDSSTPTSMTVLKESPVQLGAANRETDPIKKALEMKYAVNAAEAQQGVQDATLAPGGDPIFGSPQQTAAKNRRMMKMAAAAREFNRTLAPDDPRRKDVNPNVFYGA